MESNTLIISYEKSTENEDTKDMKHHTREYSYQSFTRTFTLQKDVVDTEKIEAKYEDVLLHLLIPKKEYVKQTQPRFIEIA